MRFDHLFIAFGIFAGAAIVLGGIYFPVIKTVPAMMWLLGLILLFDIITAYLRNVPVMESVSTMTRAFCFIGGSLVLIWLGDLGI
jgi:hypothetical protein